MSWLQLIFEVEAQHVDLVCEGLVAIGASSVTLQDAADQALYEPALNTTPLWNKTQVIGLFEADSYDAGQLESQLQELLAPLVLPPCQSQVLPEQEWTRVCMADFHAMSFGQRLWVCPSWEAPPQPDAINILLDPGLAFGTGTHATTALCLQWLDQQDDWAGKSVIDYGCGSGILAIAAAKLGATTVWAIDNDPQALQATEENARHNDVVDKIHLSLPEQIPPIQVDCLLANILADPLIELAATFAQLLKPKGTLILSGILEEQVTNVTAAYTPYFSITEVVTQEGWGLLIINC